MKYLLVIFSMLTFGACKNSKSATKEESSSSTASTVSNPKQQVQETKNPEDLKSQLPDTIRLVVSLISIGEGIDQQAPAILNAVVQHFSEQNGRGISSVRIPWGREGEQDYCYTLKELDTSKQAEFIESLKVAFKDRPLVQITENRKNRFKR